VPEISESRPVSLKNLKSKSTESNAMKHEKNTELFASLENAKFRLAEISNKPQVDA
jgi:hypothetical protein